MAEQVLDKMIYQSGFLSCSPAGIETNRSKTDENTGFSV
jgi:hypothetical protein